MKKFLLAVTLATFAVLVAMTGAKAAPVSTGNLAQSTIEQTTIEGLTLAHDGSRRHNCRRHGWCGSGIIGPGGIFIGPGVGGYNNYYGTYRSCRRVRRVCRRNWGGGRRYRRCVRRRDCRP